MAATLTVTEITAAFDRHALGTNLDKASPFIEVQAPGGGMACTSANVEHVFGKTAACSAGPMKLERAGSHLVIKVTARAQDTGLPPHAQPAETLGLARIPSESPSNGNGVQTATLLDPEGRAAGKVTVKLDEDGPAASRRSLASDASVASSNRSAAARMRSAWSKAGTKMLKAVTYMWTAPTMAYTDPAAPYRHQDAFCAAFGTFPIGPPATGTSYMRA